MKVQAANHSIAILGWKLTNTLTMGNLRLEHSRPSYKVPRPRVFPTNSRPRAEAQLHEEGMSAYNTQPSLHVVDEQARGQQRRSARLRAGSLHDEVVLPVRKWGEKAHDVGVPSSVRMAEAW